MQTAPYVCDNYIQAFVPVGHNSPRTFIACGTNSSQPFCRQYSSSSLVGMSNFRLVDEFQTPNIIQLNKLTSASGIVQQVPPPFYYKSAVYFFNTGSFTQEPNIHKQTLSTSSEPYDDQSVQDNSSYEENKMDVGVRAKFAKLVKTPRGALKSNLNNLIIKKKNNKN
jgi:hypothetical protein